jgi:dienelactone hydrolase
MIVAFIPWRTRINRLFDAVLRPLPALLLAATQAAAATDPTPGLVRESLPVPVTLAGAPVTLEGLAIRPDRPGRFPLVVMIHGTPRADAGQAPEARARVSPALFNTAAVTFARHGYATVAVLRRGFGRSGGAFAETVGRSCEARDHLPLMRISAEDVLAATARLRREPWVDPDRILLLGLSTGGAAVTAAAAAGVPGVVGVVDFAGGRGSAAPDTVCNPDGLVQAFATLGRSARIPALWVFSENDHFFGPELARRMHAAYAAAGAPARLVLLPPFGTDGHSLLTGAPADSWWPSVEPFLASLRLPTRELIALPPAPDLPAPHALNASCQAGFRDYLASPTLAKAFAITPRGRCGWSFRARSTDEAAAEALRNCATHGSPCALYARGQELAEGR